MSIESQAPPANPDPDLIPPPEDRQIVGDLIEEENPPEEVTVLTAEERRDFDRLLTIGRRTKKIIVMDHPVTIQTLKTADEMRIGLHTKPYLESQGFARAYQVGVCAAGIVDIDGSPLYRPVSEKEDDDGIFDKKIEVLKDYYPIVITQIYQGIIDLEREFADLAIKLGKLPG
jgi:hypothetical protein